MGPGSQTRELGCPRLWSSWAGSSAVRVWEAGNLKRLPAQDPEDRPAPSASPSGRLGADAWLPERPCSARRLPCAHRALHPVQGMDAGADPGRADPGLVVEVQGQSLATLFTHPRAHRAMWAVSSPWRASSMCGDSRDSAQGCQPGGPKARPQAPPHPLPFVPHQGPLGDAQASGSMQTDTRSVWTVDTPRCTGSGPGVTRR